MEKPSLLVRFRQKAGWLCLVLGLACIGVAIVFAILTAAFIHDAVETNGRIVDLVPATDEDNHSASYAPIFSFTASDGQTYTVTSYTSSNPPEFSPGESVRVLYDPRNPSHAHLKSTAQLWLVPLICAPLGAFYAILGAVLLYFDHRSRRKLVASVVNAPTSN
jgi:hypothetical protein